MKDRLKEIIGGGCAALLILIMLVWALVLFSSCTPGDATEPSCADAEACMCPDNGVKQASDTLPPAPDTMCAPPDNSDSQTTFEAELFGLDGFGTCFLTRIENAQIGPMCRTYCIVEFDNTCVVVHDKTYGELCDRVRDDLVKLGLSS
jgi:hypothetical protein